MKNMKAQHAQKGYNFVDICCNVLHFCSVLVYVKTRKIRFIAKNSSHQQIANLYVSLKWSVCEHRSQDDTP